MSRKNRKQGDEQPREKTHYERAISKNSAALTYELVLEGKLRTKTIPSKKRYQRKVKHAHASFD